MVDSKDRQKKNQNPRKRFPFELRKVIERAVLTKRQDAWVSEMVCIECRGVMTERIFHLRGRIPLKALSCQPCGILYFPPVKKQ